MTFNDSQIPSNCKFTTNMDIKTWKPGVALMFEMWSNSGTNQTFNDAIDDNGGWEDASEYEDDEQRNEWIGKLRKRLQKITSILLGMRKARLFLVIMKGTLLLGITLLSHALTCQLQSILTQKRFSLLQCIPINGNYIFHHL